jgi:hypothetical protein
VISNLRKIRPGWRITSVLAGAAVFGAAAFVVTTSANAEETAALPVTHAKKVAKDAPNDGKQRTKLPPHAKPTTKTKYRIGSYGPAFQPRSAQARIVGGSPVNSADNPSVVGIRSIFYLPNDAGGFDGYVSTCTGTVLTPTKILTAAHCTVDLPYGTTYVIAGRNNLDDENGGHVVQVQSTMVHQAHTYVDDAPRNDIAVLTLKQALPNAYPAVSLVAQGDESKYADNTAAKIVGYGVTQSGAGDSGTLRAANVPIRSDSNCSVLGPGYDNGTMVCAGNPAAHIDTCGGDSGGPLFVGTVEVGITSWGPNPCGETFGAYAQVSTFSNLIKADKDRSDPTNADWTGDGHSDLMARQPNGDLLLYSGTGLANGTFAAFTSPTARIGSGWGGYSKLFRTKNWNNDRNPALMAVTPNGDLFQYRADDTGAFTTGQPERIGNGWNNFNDIMVVNNWNADGRANLIGRNAAGDLYLYTSDGNGGWLNGGAGVKIGNGWGMFDTILTPGTWLSAGKQSRIGRTPAGALRLYQSNGSGGWVNPLGVQIGTGWNNFVRFMAPGDINGDNLTDLIGINAGGALRLYETDGKGNWLHGGTGRQIGSGWNGFNAVF